MKEKKIVLIAEDDPSLRKAISIALKDKFEVHTAENGRVAWNHIKKNKIDCLITDIDMPEMSGLELIREIRKNGYNCNVIVTTGTTRATARDECMDLGVFNFLTKPYDIFSISKIINAGNPPLTRQSSE